MRLEWRDGGGRTCLMGVTDLGRMMKIDPNMALSVLEGLGRWESGRSAGGMDPQCNRWGRLQDRGGGGGRPASAAAAAAAAVAQAPQTG